MSISIDIGEEELYDEGNSNTSESEYTDDDFPLEIDECISEKKAAEVEKYSFKVLSIEEIVQDMIDSIKEVNGIVQMPVTITRILLNHFKWDKQKLTEKYFEENQEKLFEEAHIVNPYKQKVDTSIANSSTNLNQDGSDVTEDCQICFTSLPSSQLTGLECGHRFCKDCWNEYLTTKIMDEGIVQTIACAAHDCDILVDDVSAMKLLKETRVRLRYQHLITNNFVECNKLLKWCPAAGCNYAIKVQYVDSKPVTCKCNKTFCFACGDNYHDPINCKLLRQWFKKCSDESETFNWVGANTKECPNCNASIEKNGGCNFIICRKCRHQFCWICMNPWSAHPNAWNKCNKYVETKSDSEAKTKIEKYKAALNRYLFYSNRYMSHSKSLELENQLYINIKHKMEEMQQNMTWIEVQFLKTAVDVLHECRETLKYTYAFAYFLKRSNQTEIFEENQRDLEFATETLSAYLERDIDLENLVDIKQKVQDKYKYCESRRKVLLEHVHEGYDKDIWEYLDE